MIRAQNRYFLPAQLLLDLAAILAAYAVSAPVSCFLGGCVHAGAQPPAAALPFGWSHYLYILPLLAVMPLLFLSVAGGYRHTGTRKLRRTVLPSVQAVIISASCLLGLQLLYPALKGVRLFLILFFTLVLLGFICGRLLIGRSIRTAQSGSNLVQHVLIIGTDASALQAAGGLTRECPWGLRVVGFLATDPADVGRTFGPAPVLDTVGNFDAVLSRHVVDAVLLISGMTDIDAIRALAIKCDVQGVPFGFSASGFTRRIDTVSTEGIGGLAAVFFNSVALRPEKLFVKRMFDIAASLLLIVLLLPFWIIVPVWIRHDSPGPALFSQERVGKHGRRFTMYKFRTMVQGAENMVEKIARLNEMDGPVFKIKNDPRFTGIGRFLRTTSIDELPQLFNVLKGDMSLVGPRPPIRSEVEQYLPWQRKRLAVVPGITCLWQVTGRNEIKFDEWMQLDVQYIENWSLTLDLKILIQTVTAVLSRRGAE